MDAKTREPEPNQKFKVDSVYWLKTNGGFTRVIGVNRVCADSVIGYVFDEKSPSPPSNRQVGFNNLGRQLTDEEQARIWQLLVTALVRDRDKQIFEVFCPSPC